VPKVPLDIDTNEINNHLPDDLRILVGLNGSIDSTVAAFLLKKQGFHVIGLGMALWEPGDKLKEKLTPPKCHIAKLEELRAFCESLDIQFFAADGKGQFDDNVLEFVKTNKLTGKANLSCIDCTKLQLTILHEKMQKLSCHFMATGHYAKTYKNHQSNEFFVHSANDVQFDQSFLISGCEQQVLRKILFPLSELKRSEVVKIAKNFSLRLHESDGESKMCFQDDPAFPKYLEKCIPESLRERATVLEADTDNYVSDIKGFYEYYVGQRNISFEEGKKTIDRNIEVVDFDFTSKNMYVHKKDEVHLKGAQIVEVDFTSDIDRTRPQKIYCKFFDNNDYHEATLYYKNNNTLYIEFSEREGLLAEGEKVVFYDRNTKSSRILGEGKIAARGEYKEINRGDEFKSRGFIKNEDEEDEKRRPRF
jgi:tRNA-specific 2-thiouridylase